MDRRKILAFARRNRRNPTPAEAFFWEKVRNRQILGRKCRRQHPILHSANGKKHAYFIADFFFLKEKIIIEIDGEIHAEQQEYDQMREDTLKALGYTVLRFTNYEELDTWTKVERIIKAALNNT